jgi:hypothetical protein
VTDDLDLDGIRKRHLSLDRLANRTFYTGHIVLDLADCVGEVERLREQRDAFLRALDHEVLLVDTHDILLPTSRLRELRRLLAPCPLAR